MFVESRWVQLRWQSPRALTSQTMRGDNPFRAERRRMKAHRRAYGRGRTADSPRDILPYIRGNAHASWFQLMRDGCIERYIGGACALAVVTAEQRSFEIALSIFRAHKRGHRCYSACKAQTTKLLVIRYPNAMPDDADHIDIARVQERKEIVRLIASCANHVSEETCSRR